MVTTIWLPVAQPRSPRSSVAAELILSDEARRALESSSPYYRRLLREALDAIESDHDWGASPARFIAPATSKHVGHIVDLSVSGWAIVYRPVDKGAHVEVPSIYQVMIG